MATDAPDGSATYLHVLKAPKEKTLRIGMPANGERFAHATLLPGGEKVELLFDAAGYLVKLPPDVEWNPLNTVIRLQRKN